MEGSGLAIFRLGPSSYGRILIPLKLPACRWNPITWRLPVLWTTCLNLYIEWPTASRIVQSYKLVRSEHIRTYSGIFLSLSWAQDSKSNYCRVFSLSQIKWKKSSLYLAINVFAVGRVGWFVLLQDENWLRFAVLKLLRFAKSAGLKVVLPLASDWPYQQSCRWNPITWRPCGQLMACKWLRQVTL